MNTQAIVLLVAAVAFFAYHWFHDRWASLNQFADDVEADLLPGLGLGWFTYQKLGCPISWVHHALWTWLGGAILGALLWQLGGSYAVGHLLGSCVMLAWYVPREVLDVRNNYRKHGGWAGAFSITLSHPFVGWLLDSIGDVLGPAYVVWLALRRLGIT